MGVDLVEHPAVLPAAHLLQGLSVHTIHRQPTGPGVAEQVGVDVFADSRPNRRSLEGAADFLLGVAGLAVSAAGENPTILWLASGEPDFKGRLADTTVTPPSARPLRKLRQRTSPTGFIGGPMATEVHV